MNKPPHTIIVIFEFRIEWSAFPPRLILRKQLFLLWGPHSAPSPPKIPLGSHAPYFSLFLHPPMPIGLHVFFNVAALQAFPPFHRASFLTVRILALQKPPPLNKSSSLGALSFPQVLIDRIFQEDPKNATQSTPFEVFLTMWAELVGSSR